MSVFSLDVKAGNPVTADTVDKLCSQLGVSLEKEHEEDYRRLLAVFHDACESLMEIEGMWLRTEVRPLLAGSLPQTKVEEARHAHVPMTSRCTLLLTLP